MNQAKMPCKSAAADVPSVWKKLLFRPSMSSDGDSAIDGINIYCPTRHPHHSVPGNVLERRILSPSEMKGMKRRKSRGVTMRLKMLAAGTLNLKMKARARQRRVVVPRCISATLTSTMGTNPAVERCP